MAAQGARIDLLTYGEGADVDIKGVRMVRIPRIPGLAPIPVGPSWKKAVLDVLMVAWTLALLVRRRYDAVHAHEEAVFWARALRPLFRYRLIYDMHSSLPQQLANFRFSQSRLLTGLFRRLEDSALHAADAVVTICPALRDYALGAGVPPARHIMIENSIFESPRLSQRASAFADEDATIDALCRDRSRPIVLYAGTFEAYQGIEMLIGAFAEVAPEAPEALLVLAGGNARQVESMRRLAEALEIGGRCRFTGQVAKSTVERLTLRADVLVSPRLHGTNTPLKIYEQLASGKPLVATRIGSHTQVLGEDVALLVEPNASDLARGIALALRDRERAARIAVEARRLYEREYSRPVYEAKIGRLLAMVAA
jgi:glycosyltransferase involved in cell wall biosynthesis